MVTSSVFYTEENNQLIPIPQLKLRLKIGKWIADKIGLDAQYVVTGNYLEDCEACQTESEVIHSVFRYAQTGCSATIELQIQ